MVPVGYLCGDFYLDPSNRRLTRRGVEIALEPRTFAVLLQLVSRAGALVARNEILDAVWGHRHVTPSALNRRIALVRRVVLAAWRTAPCAGVYGWGAVALQALLESSKTIYEMCATSSSTSSGSGDEAPRTSAISN